MRKAKGCTKIELLNLTNLSQQYISNVERGYTSVYL
ncbi:helix-turn-helix domain-containing protein [Lachnoanaerobaculum saburreum]